jgi:hypothetical protein
LATHRQEVLAVRTAEHNRLEHVGHRAVRRQIEHHLIQLDRQLKQLTAWIGKLIQASVSLKIVVTPRIKHHINRPT